MSRPKQYRRPRVFSVGATILPRPQSPKPVPPPPPEPEPMAVVEVGTAPLRDAADVGRNRERARRRRVATLAAVVAAVVFWALARLVTGHPVYPVLPKVDPMYLMSGLFFLVLIASLLITQIAGGRSPHLTYRPEQIDVRMNDVVGLGPVREEVQRSLDLFLGGRTFRTSMGGTPRRGLLFEGTPGTGKTHMAKALAAEAGVPFLFVSATSFQSMYYGATARKIRSYFKALRKAARTEGGAIGFIEEIDAIALARSGLNTGMTAAAASTTNCCGGLVGLPSAPGGFVRQEASAVNRAVSEGTGGVVNELLVQLQSFDEPTGWQKLRGRVTDSVNLLLPANRQIPRPRTEPLDILLIAATNRADNLDPALLRPGRFDRRLTFDLPDHAGRRELIDHFLNRKRHDDAMAGAERRDTLAGVTQGYSPVMIEHLLDEALVNALRRGDTQMSWQDVEHARLVTEVGLGQPVNYTEHEKRVIATHEAGHAVVAFLEAPNRRLEILSIVKRAAALGLLAHGDRQDVYTRSSAELSALIRIAFGGMVAERQFFGDTTTGPASDLQYATTMAATMVGSAGMGPSVVSLAAVDGSLAENLVGRVVSDSQGRKALEALLESQRDYVQALLAGNADLVEALRDALLERHELIGHEITDVLVTALARRPAPQLDPARPEMEPPMIDLTVLEAGIRSIPVDHRDTGMVEVRIVDRGLDAPDLPQRDR